MHQISERSASPSASSGLDRLVCMNKRKGVGGLAVSIRRQSISTGCGHVQLGTFSVRKHSGKHACRGQKSRSANNLAAARRHCEHMISGRVPIRDTLYVAAVATPIRRLLSRHCRLPSGGRAEEPLIMCPHTLSPSTLRTSHIVSLCSRRCDDSRHLTR